MIATKTLEQLPDSTLIQNFIDGEEHAMAILLHRYKQNIYTTIYLLVKDRYIAEDIFQDTFVKIVQTLRQKRYAEQGKFLPWALRISHNLCIDYFRRAKQSVKVTFPDGSDIFSYITSPVESAEQKTIRKESEHYLHQIIDKLPIEQKEVILLRIYGDLSFKQIAETTHVSINTALGRMRYGLINLKKMLVESNLPLR